MYKTIY